jgi:ABC-2 type transport system permease protein
MKPEMIIAVKEFKDYLTSKIFLVIFGLLVLIMIASIVAGTGTYNTRLDSYNSELSMISSRTAAGNATGGAMSFQPTMPSIMLIFESFSTIFVLVGWVLALVIGFSLISKEKESGSLKLLLARPTYRDSIIIGKILGSTAILVLSLAAAFLIAVAILLFEGIVPTGDDLTRLCTFFLMVVIFSVAFLAIAIAASSIARNSTMAILLALMIAVFSLMVPYFTDSLCTVALGDSPNMMVVSTDTSTSSSGISGSIGMPGEDITMGGRGGNSSVRMTVNPEYTSYWTVRNQITEAINLISPTSDLEGISNVVVSGEQSPVSSSSSSGTFNFRSSGMSTPTLGDSISSILPQILALLVMIIAGFAISYAKFVRMDVR